MRAQTPFGKVLAVGLVYAACFAVAGVAFLLTRAAASTEPLRPPEFHDVSAFADSDVAQIDAWLREQVDRVRYPSLSVAVVRDGRIAYQRAFGFADLESQQSATPETAYHVASVTKVFTTLMALMLHERGIVELDRPAVKYLPQGVRISTSPEIGATITPRQLASHTSGLPRGIPGPVQSVEGRYELQPELLYEHLAEVTLESDPGTGELYSNLAMGLLGHVLECASGKPYEQLLQELICEPLHLERTTINQTDALHVATAYSSELPRTPEPHEYRERLAPSGGLIASAPDLANFLAVHMQPGFLSREIRLQVFTPAKLLDGSMVETTLGWSVVPFRSGDVILEKNGGRNNCTAWIGFAPLHKVGVAVVANCGEPSVDPIGLWLLERSVPGGTQPAKK